MANSNRIGFIITDLDTGGAELALERYVGYLANSGADAFICSLTSLGTVGQRLRDRGAPVFALGMTPWNAPLALMRLIRLLRRERPNVVCSMMFHANIAARLARIACRFPLLLSMERTMHQDTAGRLALHRLTSPLADKVIAVSPVVGRYAVTHLGVSEDKVEVLPNAVDGTRFRNLPDPAACRVQIGFAPDDFLITCVANLRPIKGHRFLLRAFANVYKEHPAAALLLVGDGELKKELEALAADLGISSRMRITGELPDIRPALSASSIFVMPSLTEGMSNAVLEALACGLPVVATSVGGTPDVIRHGENGLLVPPEDSSALAAAILRLMRNPQEMKRLATNARAFAEANHSPQVEREFILRLLNVSSTVPSHSAIPA